MIIQCYLNTEQFSSDIGEVIRLFFPMDELQYASLPAQEFSSIIGVISRLNEKTADAWVHMPDGRSGVWLSEKVKQSHNTLEQKRYQKRAIKRAVFMAMMQAYPERHFPWGCLTGIRPTKMFHDMLKEQTMDSICETMEQYYLVSLEKIALMKQIVIEQQRMDEVRKQNDFDLYIGIPFCRTRCVYCSFAAYELGKKLAFPENVEQYVSVLVREIESNMAMAFKKGYSLRSVYIGGGTPTALSRAQLEKIIDVIQQNYQSQPLELTVEAGRPDTIDYDKLKMLHDHGIDRISINPQTTHDETLRRIRRDHTYQQFLDAYALARTIGFSCINVDLIVGLPGETPEMMRQTMEEMKKLAPENLTIHTLAIKRSADLKRTLDHFELPDADDAEEMLRIGHEGALSMGLVPYYMYRQKYMSGNLENIGYALLGKESLYNVDIMEERTNILALGSGGISKWLFDNGRIEREPNPKDVPTYCNKMETMTERRSILIPNIE